MSVENLLGWVGLFLIGAIGAVTGSADWVASGSAYKNLVGVWRRCRMARMASDPLLTFDRFRARSVQRTARTENPARFR